MPTWPASINSRGSAPPSQRLSRCCTLHPRRAPPNARGAWSVRGMLLLPLHQREPDRPLDRPLGRPLSRPLGRCARHLARRAVGREAAPSGRQYGSSRVGTGRPKRRIVGRARVGALPVVRAHLGVAAKLARDLPAQPAH
eukprot:7385504-Prymnesium_polylepis.1